MSNTARTKHNKMRRLFEVQDGLCPLCECEMTHPDDVRAAGLSNHPDAPSLDHMTPQAHRGPNALTNLMLVHRGCNEARGCAPLHRNVLMFMRQAKARLVF